MTDRAVIEPVHVHNWGNYQLRFFVSPIWQKTREADKPWVSLDDVSKLCDLPKFLQDFYRQITQRDWLPNGICKTIATIDDGITNIVPADFGRGLIGAMRDIRRDLPAKQKKLIIPIQRQRIIDTQFTLGLCFAYDKMLGGLSGPGKLGFVLAAHQGNSVLSEAMKNVQSNTADR